MFKTNLYKNKSYDINFIHKNMSLYDLYKKYKVYVRAGEPANFFSAPAPDFFFKRLRLLIFFPKRLRLRLLVFFQAAPAPDYWSSLPKYSFPHKLLR